MTESTSGSAKQGSLFEDILEVNWAPGAVFERARDSGAGKYILVLTVVCLVIVVATKGLVQPYIDANFDLQMQLMARRGQAMPPEAIETARRFGAYGYLGTAVLLVPMSALFGGVILWLSAKLVTAPGLRSTTPPRLRTIPSSRQISPVGHMYARSSRLPRTTPTTPQLPWSWTGVHWPGSQTIANSEIVSRGQK